MVTRTQALHLGRPGPVNKESEININPPSSYNKHREVLTLQPKIQLVGLAVSQYITAKTLIKKKEKEIKKLKKKNSLPEETQIS